MDVKRSPPASRLFSGSLLEAKDELEDKYERCYAQLQTIIQAKGDKECNDALNVAVAKDKQSHDDICVGFVVAILSEPELAGKYYNHLTMVARDGQQFILAEVTRLVLDKYLKLKESARQQLLWLTREMIKNQVQNIDGICWNLMRQIAGGDVSQRNLWLADSLMDIYTEHRAWLEKYPFLLASVVYTYLRVIEDHAHANLATLRNKEVKFVVGLIRDRFQDVLVIGRDFVRLLQYSARIPEIEDLWQDILHHPTNLSPNFTGLTQLMQLRTSRRFLQSRISPDMEKKLVFLTSQVRFGSHKRYQDWFQKHYLSTPESQSLRCDLIRFIVGVIHPTNELLCSDIIPRWAVIGWLLTTCTNQVAASNAKLALFYDWLFYEADKDNIMNIEPAILVMHHSMRPHPAITATLLDFICRIINNFCPALTDKVRGGIYSSLRQIVDKRVLPSLSPLFDNPRLDRELRSMLKEKFGQFLRNEEGSQGDVPQSFVLADPEYSNPGDPNNPAFSDDEDDVVTLPSPSPPVLAVTPLGTGALQPLEKEEPQVRSPPAVADLPTPPVAQRQSLEQEVPLVQRRNSGNHTMGATGTTAATNGEGEEELEQEILDRIDDLREETNCERRCEIVERLVQAVISEQVEQEGAALVAGKLSQILQDQFEGKIFPENPTPESIEDSIGQPLFVIFRSLCEISDIDPSRQPVLSVLAEMYALQPRLGYYLLYYLRCYTQLDSKSKANLYKDLCEAIDDNNSLDICLVNDMRQCQEDDVSLFVYLLPDIYTHFQKAAIGNVDLLYLVVSCVDASQILTLVCHIVARDFIMFKKDSFQPVLTASLSWETFEQYALWQLLAGHDLPIDCVLPLIPKLAYSKHAEALTSISLLLKREKPTAELVKHLMSREVNSCDRFVTSVLTCWINDYEDKLGDLIGSQLCKQASPAGGKRKRNATVAKGPNSLGPLAEMTLGHLDQLRQTCKQYDLFNLRSIQHSLQTVRGCCTDNQKKKFSDLFALADSESEDEAMHKSRSKTKPLKSPGKAKPKTGAAGSAGGGSAVNSGSSEESSDSESEEKPPAKKGRGAAAAKNQRKRTNKVSYKEMGSTDDSTDDEDDSKKTAKKRKKVMSESD